MNLEKIDLELMVRVITHISIHMEVLYGCYLASFARYSMLIDKSFSLFICFAFLCQSFFSIIHLFSQYSGCKLHLKICN